jgi:hypothetical protein
MIISAKHYALEQWFGDFVSSLEDAGNLTGKFVPVIDAASKQATKFPASQFATTGTNAVQTLTSAANITMNVANGRWAKLTLGQNTNFNFSGLTTGSQGRIFITMGGSGNHTINWGSAKVPTSGLALSGTVGDLTVIDWSFDGTNIVLTKVNYGPASVTPPADTTPPFIQGDPVLNIANKIWVTMSEGCPNFSQAGFTAVKNGLTWTISGSVGIGGAVYELQMASNAAPGDTVTLGYSTSAGGVVADAAGNPLATLSTPKNVENNLTSGPQTLNTPTVGAEVIGGTYIRITWNSIANAIGYAADKSQDGTTWEVYNSSIPSGTLNFTDAGLADGTYYYRVRALGNGTTYQNSAWGQASATINTSTGGGGGGTNVLTGPITLP